MATEVRLFGGIRRTHPDPHERRRGAEPEVQLTVTVGKSDRHGATILELLRKERLTPSQDREGERG